MGSRVSLNAFFSPFSSSCLPSVFSLPQFSSFATWTSFSSGSSSSFTKVIPKALALVLGAILSNHSSEIFPMGAILWIINMPGWRRFLFRTAPPKWAAANSVLPAPGDAASVKRAVVCSCGVLPGRRPNRGHFRGEMVRRRQVAIYSSAATALAAERQDLAVGRNILSHFFV